MSNEVRLWKVCDKDGKSFYGTPKINYRKNVGKSVRAKAKPPVGCYRAICSGEVLHASVDLNHAIHYAGQVSDDVVNFTYFRVIGTVCVKEDDKVGCVTLRVLKEYTENEAFALEKKRLTLTSGNHNFE